MGRIFLDGMVAAGEDEWGSVGQYSLVDWDAVRNLWEAARPAWRPPHTQTPGSEQALTGSRSPCSRSPLTSSTLRPPPPSRPTSSRGWYSRPTRTSWMSSVPVRHPLTFLRSPTDVLHATTGCFNITTVFSHAQTVVLCGSCSTVLCQPTGGKARLTEGLSLPHSSSASLNGPQSQAALSGKRTRRSPSPSFDPPTHYPIPFRSRHTPSSLSRLLPPHQQPSPPPLHSTRPHSLINFQQQGVSRRTESGRRGGTGNGGGEAERCEGLELILGAVGL